MAKSLQEVVKTTFCVCRRTIFGLKKLSKVLNRFWIFCRNLWHGSQNFISVSRVKTPEEINFLFFFSEFFRILSEIFSDFWPKNFKKLSKLPSTCPEEQFVAWFFFFKSWTVLDFVQKHLACFSNFYLGVQSKNCGRINFFVFLFLIFSNFEQKIFRLLAKKLQDVFKTTFYVSRGTRCGLNFFKKIWIVLDFLQKPLAWFSKFYLRLQSKNCGRKFFFVLLFRTFSDFERKIFRLWAKRLQEVVKTTFYVCRGTVCGLKFFFIFWIFLEFLEKPLAWFSKFYLRVQSKNCGRIYFFILLFRIFWEFERKIFRLSAKKLQEVVKNIFRVCGWTNFGLEIFFKCFEPFWIFCRNLWHGSQSSIYVSRVKIAEELVFFLFFFSEFFRFLRKNFSNFWPKVFKKLSKLPSACSDEQVLAWNFFQKFWTVLNFLQKPLAWCSNFYLRVQSKNSGRNNFF